MTKHILLLYFTCGLILVVLVLLFLAHGFMMRSVRYYSISLISNPDLWLSEPKERSGEVRKFNFSDWLDYNLPESAMACEIYSLQSLQFC